MSKNTNTIQKLSDEVSQVAQQAGIAVMTLAAVAGMIDLPSHPNNRIILPSQTNFAFAGETDEAGNNPLRREKEETDQHYISYSVAQRTPARAGKR